jgi:hypothetical protein
MLVATKVTKKSQFVLFLIAGGRISRYVNELKKVVVHSDGSCHGNPGPGGWAAVLEYGKHKREMSGGVPATTNNRMELQAAIEAAECAEGGLRGQVLHGFGICEEWSDGLVVELEAQRLEDRVEAAGEKRGSLAGAGSGGVKAHS